MTPYEQKLQSFLSSLGRMGLSIFACACAERMYPCMSAYEAKFGSRLSTQVRSSLVLCWDHLMKGGGNFPLSSEGLTRLILDTDHPDWVMERIYLDDPAASAALANDVLVYGGNQKAFAVATFSTLDFLVAHANRSGSHETIVEMGQVEGNAAICTEISRQLRDAAELSALKVIDADIVARFRRRAESEPILPGLVL